MERWILHIDMDAFYASIEQRDNPEYRGKPVIVGGLPGQRGVVSAASYEARKFGLYSGMSISQAYRLCPQGIYLPVRMTYYTGISGEIMSILRDYSPLVEPISLDEAFLDLSGTVRLFGPVDKTAKIIQNRIKQEIRLTASVGLAECKHLAKIASDLKKPNGFVMIRPEEEKEILRHLPISVIWGVGHKTEKILAQWGIKTIEDLWQYPKEFIIRHLGKFGEHIYDLSMGEDDREVVPDSVPKSCGNESTFLQDLTDMNEIKQVLLTLCEKTAYRLRKQQLAGKTVTLKLRYADFTTLTRSVSINRYINQSDWIYYTAVGLLDKILLNGKRKNPSLRLIGISVSNLIPAGQQEELFQNQKVEQLHDAIDRLNEKYQIPVIHRASTAPYLNQFPETIYKD